MKKFKTGLLALALVLGVSGAFATKVAQAPKATEEVYDWDGAGPEHSGQIETTIDGAQTYYGCSGAADVCATGTNVNNPLDVQTLRFDQ